MITQDAVVSTFSRSSRADAGARRHRRHLARGRRHRHHERDAGLGLRAHARGRPAARRSAPGRGQILAVFLAEAVAALVRRRPARPRRSAGPACGVLVAVYPALPARAAAVGGGAPRSPLSVAVGALFGVLPARRAARLDPVHGARGEMSRCATCSASRSARSRATACARSSRCSASRSASRPVILLTSIGEGTRATCSAQFTQFGTNIIAVNPGKSKTFGMPGVLGGTTHKLTIDDAEALARIPGVETVVPVAVGLARVEAGERGRSVSVSASRPTCRRLEVRRAPGLVLAEGRPAPRRRRGGARPEARARAVRRRAARSASSCASRGTPLPRDRRDGAQGPVPGLRPRRHRVRARWRARCSSSTWPSCSRSTSSTRNVAETARVEAEVERLLTRATATRTSPSPPRRPCSTCSAT